MFQNIDSAWGCVCKNGFPCKLKKYGQGLKGPKGDIR